MNKKEFKKKCKAEKTKSYRASLIGAVLACIGFVIVFAVLFLDQQMHIFQYPLQIVGYVIGAIFAIVGMVFDILGEITFNKEYKEYLNSNSKQK